MVVNCRRHVREYGRYDDSNGARIDSRDLMGVMGAKLFLVVIYGRQMGYSVGMMDRTR